MFWGKFYPFIAPKPPKQRLLPRGKVATGFGNGAQLPAAHTSLPEKPNEL